MQTVFYATGSLLFVALIAATVFLCRSLSELNQSIRSTAPKLDAALTNLMDSASEMTKAARSLSTVSSDVPAVLVTCHQASQKTLRIVELLEPVAVNLDDITANIKDIIERVRTGQDSGKNSIFSNLLATFSRR